MLTPALLLCAIVFPSHDAAPVHGRQRHVKVADGRRSFVLVTPRNAQHAAAMEAISKGEWNRALGLLLAIVDELPGDGIVAMQLADVSFRVSEPRVAYSALRPYLENEKLRTRLQGVTLRAFLAGIATGEVDDRLREYSVAHVRFLGRGLGDDFVAGLPQSNSSRDLELVTTVALGLHCDWTGERDNAVYYLSRARGLDAGNPVVSLALGRALIEAKRLTDATDVLQSGLIRSTGKLRAAIQAELDRAVRDGEESVAEQRTWKGIGGI